MAYQLKTKQFEGPLDVLLELIKKQKLEISEISLSEVADHFLDFIEKNQTIDPVELSDFLVIAAKLLYIKSKILLPIIEEDDEDELNIHELEFQLKEYEKFKNAQETFRKKFEDSHLVFEKQFVLTKTPTFFPGENATTENLKNALKKVTSYLEEQEVIKEKKIEKTVSLSEKISSIQTKLSRQKSFNFNALLSSSESKTEVVVTFLALLELIKTKSIEVTQDQLFGDLSIEKISS